MPGMILALDSNIFIAALSPHETGSIKAQKAIREIAAGKYGAVASSIVYGEVLDMSSSKELDVQDFFAHIAHLSTVAADDGICLEAGRLRQKYGSALKLPDALHLATALTQKAGTFVTDDSVLAKIAGKVMPVQMLSELA